jgi:hypothetical protein
LWIVESFMALLAVLDGDAGDAAERIASSLRPIEDSGWRGLLASILLADAGLHALRGDLQHAQELWRAALAERDANGETTWEWFAERAVEEQLLRPLVASE